MPPSRRFLLRIALPALVILVGMVVTVLVSLTQMAGVLTIVLKGDPATLVRLDFVVGDLWVATAAFCWAVYSIWLRRRPSTLDPLTRLAAITFAGVLVLAPLTAIESVTVGVPALDARSVAAALIVGLLPGFGAYQAWSWLIREIGPSRTSLILYLTPVYTAFLAWLLLGETPHWYHAVGAALAFSGLYLANRAARSA
jgi:drug/metabolite transporter (DMT)-like permease